MGKIKNKMMLIRILIVVETRTPRQILNNLLNNLQFSFVS